MTMHWTSADVANGSGTDVVMANVIAVVMMSIIAAADFNNSWRLGF